MATKVLGIEMDYRDGYQGTRDTDTEMDYRDGHQGTRGRDGL